MRAHALQLTFGLTNGTVVELGPTPPVPVTELSGGAPSTMLPVHAATFQPDAGRTFSRTVSRDAPPDDDGQPRFWVQPKDIQPPTDHEEPPSSSRCARRAARATPATCTSIRSG